MGNFGAFHLSPCTELDARKQLLTGNGTASSSRRADGVTAHRGRPAHPPRLIRAMASLRLRLGLATQVLEVARENSPDSIFQGNEFQTRPIHDPTVAPVPRNDMADEGTNCPGQHLHLKALNREREAVHISYAQPPGVFDKSTRKADVDEAGCAELKLNRGFRSNEDTRPPPRNGAAHPSQRLQSWWCLFQVATGVEDFLVPVHGMHPSDAAVKKSSEEASPSARGSPTTEDRPFLVANSVPAPLGNDGCGYACEHLSVFPGFLRPRVRSPTEERKSRTRKAGCKCFTARSGQVKFFSRSAWLTGTQ